MASKELKHYGVILDSEGSNFDAIYKDGVETRIMPLVDVDNPHRLCHIFTVAND